MNPPEGIEAADRLREPKSVLEPDPRTRKSELLADRQARIAQYRLIDSVPHAVRVHFETAKNLYLYAWFVYRFHPVAEKHALATLEFALRERLAPIYPDRYGRDVAWVPGLAKKLKDARADGLISNDGMRAYHRQAMRRARERVSDEATRQLIESGAEFVEYDPDGAVPVEQDYSWDALDTYLETLPEIRNMYAHGSKSLHASVLGTFEIVTDLVNQLFPSSASDA